MSYEDSMDLMDRDLEERTPCRIVSALAVMKAFSGPATSFCSSFLRIGTSTSTTTLFPSETSVYS